MRNERDLFYGMDGINLASLDPRVRKIVTTPLPRNPALTIGLHGEERHARPAQVDSDGPRMAIEAQKHL